MLSLLNLLARMRIRVPQLSTANRRVQLFGDRNKRRISATMTCFKAVETNAGEHTSGAISSVSASCRGFQCFAFGKLFNDGNVQGIEDAHMNAMACGDVQAPR
jgi:hypothetical protein